MLCAGVRVPLFDLVFERMHSLLHRSDDRVLAPKTRKGRNPSALLIYQSNGDPKAFSGSFYTLAHFGDLKLAIDYYIDSLTLIMFCMVTLIATCIHIFAIGYMSDELTDDYVDHQVHTADGEHLHRNGRFYLFFSYMSLFCFSMLGLVIAGNIFMVFIFWELVGICSYLLIGFYTERKSASNAANKAFIMKPPKLIDSFSFLITSTTSGWSAMPSTKG